MVPRQLRVSVTEYHTAGEPFRIVTGGTGPILGQTILEKRRFAQERLDHVRRLVINEPRGHADMYGCFVTEPATAGAAFGTLFFHNEGYSTACGHGTIALATWAVEHGIVEPPAGTGETVIVIDVPSGPVEAVARVEADRVTSVGFRNVPAFVYATDIPVASVAGDLVVDVTFGGAFYAIVDAEELGIAVAPENLDSLIRVGRSIKAALMDKLDVRHPEEPQLQGIYGVIFYQREPDEDGRMCQRNVTVFADGEVDRSPCGSGTSARLAHLFRRGELGVADELLHRSIIGTEFTGRIRAQVRAAGHDAVLTEVTGSAHLTGTHQFILEPDDPLGTGFLLR
jgi:proline racemase/trans-L-3-hydroxyproline dehydratase